MYDAINLVKQEASIIWSSSTTGLPREKERKTWHLEEERERGKEREESREEEHRPTMYKSLVPLCSTVCSTVTIAWQ